MSVVVEHLAVGALLCNCTILADVAAGEAIVVDGGDEADAIVARLELLGVRARYLMHTHAHFDHIGAYGELHERTGARGLLHPGDRPLYAMLAQQCRVFGAPPPRTAHLEDLRDGDRITAGAIGIEALHTPGHTHGSTSFVVTAPDDAAAAPLLLTGDTLFAGAVGRWDLGGTSLADIVRSIREKLLPFGDGTIVVPGHGPSTTIGIERRTNPYLTH